MGTFEEGATTRGRGIRGHGLRGSPEIWRPMVQNSAMSYVYKPTVQQRKTVNDDTDRQFHFKQVHVHPHSTGPHIVGPTWCTVLYCTLFTDQNIAARKTMTFGWISYSLRVISRSPSSPHHSHKSWNPKMLCSSKAESKSQCQSRLTATSTRLSIKCL